MSKILGTAVLWGWIEENLTKGVTLPRMERRRVPRVLTLEEIGKLAEALREPARTIFVLGILTSPRIGELLGLKLGDVDLERGILSVRSSVSRDEVGPTKTPGSERRFPLPEPIDHLIRAHLATRTVQSGWLFPTLKGNRHNDRTLFSPICPADDSASQVAALFMAFHAAYVSHLQRRRWGGHARAPIARRPHRGTNDPRLH